MTQKYRTFKLSYHELAGFIARLTNNYFLGHPNWYFAMQDICRFSVKEDITIIRFSRQPDLSEIIPVLDELAANYPQQLRLWDMSDIVIDQSHLELHEIARHAAKAFAYNTRAAFVANDDLTFGTLRMFEVFSEQHSGEARSRVFRSMEEARNWLNRRLAG